MKLTCYACGYAPEWSVNNKDYCEGCYSDRGYCDCIQCAKADEPCSMDCEDDLCPGCYERRMDRVEDDYNSSVALLRES